MFEDICEDVIADLKLTEEEEDARDKKVVLQKYLVQTTMMT